MSKLSDDRIHIAMAVDRAYAMPLAAVLAGIVKVHDVGEVAITVLHSGISTQMRTQITRGQASSLDIEWISVDTSTLEGASFPRFLSPATLYRLLLPSLLPEECDRTIYLDADIALLDNLRGLWDVSLGNALVGAVADAGSPWAAGATGCDWRSLGMPPDAPYFNAGVLLIPLDVWRGEGVAKHALEILRTCGPRWADQDALNVVGLGRWKQLPRRWNVQTADIDGLGVGWAHWRDEIEAALADPAVVHFTGRAKPWTPGPAHPWTDRWTPFVDQTAWEGWRAGERSLARKVVGRVRRAGKVLVAG